MNDQHTSKQRMGGWAGLVERLEDGLRFPEGRGGKLVRPRHSRKVAGVCSGLAEYFGWNVSLLRVLAVALAIASTGLMVVAYLAAWVVFRDGQYYLPDGVSRQSGTSPS